jgi:hypothetical protein
MTSHRTALFFSLTAAAFLLTGCNRAYTEIQLRDAADHTPIVGQSVGRLGPLHCFYNWTLTDTSGVAHVRTSEGWSTLDFVVAGAGRRIEARGTLLAGTDAWVALTPEPGAPTRIEARAASGEGAPIAPKPRDND